MIGAISLYNDVNFRINKNDNGYLSYDDFNNISWLAQLSFLDWLSGDVAGIHTQGRYAQPVNLPEPFDTQKLKDWLSDFTVKKPLLISGGVIAKPADYYLFQNLYKINGTKKDDDGKETYVPNKSIELLESSKFNTRVETFIEELKPKNKPIARVVKDTIEFEPRGIGSVMLEYIRYPKRAKIAVVPNQVDEFGEQIIDTANTVDFEWGEYARGQLIWFICREFAMHIREQSLFQVNETTQK